jgi:outer membrane receptor protein involved in Fe transport
MRKTPLAVAIGVALTHGPLALITPVLAQSLDDAVSEEGLEEIVVTGSRIRKDAFTSSTPMDIIDIGEASIQGIANVGELLQRNTVASGSPQITSATSSEFVQNGGVGATTLSLRGLGANRTLVLLNGRRAGPSGTRGSVSSFDLNVLPIATIDRVEILKDGASSIYGSDAVAGVVNIITRKDDGGSIDGFVSQPTDSGGEHSRISATWGQSFDRGSFRITADYDKQEKLARGDRDYFDCGQQFIFDTTTGARADTIDPRTGQARCRDLSWGHIWVYDYAGGTTNVPSDGSASTLFQYDYDSDLAQYIPGLSAADDAGDLVVPAGWFPVAYDVLSDGPTNSDHPAQNAQSLVPENELITLYLEADYEISDSMELYSELLLNRRTTKVTSYRQFWSYTYAYGFLAAQEGWSGSQWYSPTAITEHNDQEIEINYTRFVAGLRGDLGDTTWSWDATLQISDSDGDYTDDQIFNDSIADNVGQVTSCVGTVSSVRGAPCVDVNWLSPDVMAGVLTAAERDFLFGVETGNTSYKQWSLDGFVTGEIMELPAGPLSIATGFHYREDEIDDLPGEITLAGNGWGSSAAGNTVGDDKTKAIFVEFDVPLVADVPALHNVTLNASARYTDVDSYGDGTTWKVGLNWSITETVRLRANRGTSFRTPALFELFLANETSFPSVRIDPCRDWGAALANGSITQTTADNCAADQSSIGGPAAGFLPTYLGGAVSPTSTAGGGFGVLEAETSDSQTFGLIWQPEFADLSLSVDYFDISVKNEVTQLGPVNILEQCYLSDFGFAFGATEPLCNLFDRTGTNFGVDNIVDDFRNIAKQDNRGIDYAVRYNTEVGSWGSLSVQLQATRTLEDTQALFPNSVDDLNGLVGDPEWVGQYSFSLIRGPLAVYYGGNWIGASDSTRDNNKSTVTYRNTEYDAVLSTDHVVYHNFSVSYDFENSGFTALLGVSNFTDKAPPRVTTQSVGSLLNTIGNTAFYSQYDWLGRRVFANVSYTFE